MPDDLNVNLEVLQTEYDGLQISHTELAEQLATVKEELKPMKEIRYWVGRVLTLEQEVEKKPEPKHSVTEQMKYMQEQSKHWSRNPHRRNNKIWNFKALAVFILKMSAAFLFIEKKMYLITLSDKISRH